MSELLNYWRNRVEKDLSPFADPGTKLRVQSLGYSVQVEWTQRRKDLSASFRLSQADGSMSVDFHGQKYTYSAFFSCEQMGDLLGLAKMILQASKPAVYVETSASEEREDGSEQSGHATDLIQAAITQDTVGTNVVMVTGEAGAGKTSVLKQLVLKAAEEFSRKQTGYLLLYVDAQGRALARFSEALATELQDLRVNLTYHSVSTLVRLGLLVPVVDGFDELIGVGGYDDAFSSISQFIEELEGLGSILASARSTYYEHEFLSRANRSSSLGAQIWRLRSIAVNGWGDSEREKYTREQCAENGLDEAEAQTLIIRTRKVFSGENEALGRKPLFVARTVKALLSGGNVSGEGALLDQLVQIFLRREQQEKLLGRGGRPLLSTEQLVALYADLAEEMWNQGTRELDKGSARELAEMALMDAQLAASDKQVVTERMPSLAFLEPGEASGAISFEHEIFFGYFLAQRLTQRILSNSTGLSLLLSRSVLPEALAEAAAKELIRLEGDRHHAVIAQLCQAAAVRALRQGQAQENAALIVASVMQEGSKLNLAFENLHIHDLIFPGASLRGVTLLDCQLTRIEFRRTEFCGTQFKKCKSVASMFYSVLVDGNSLLDISGADQDSFSGLQVLEKSDRVRQLFDPLEIREELSRRGLATAHTTTTPITFRVDPAIVKLIERFSRAFLKRNPVCVQDDFLQGIFSDSTWPKLQRLLIDAEIVKTETRDTHGPKRLFLRRLINHEEIPAGLRKEASVSSQVRKFWESVEREFPPR